MRITAFSALALGFGLLSVELSACSNSSDDCTANATCGTTAGSGHAGTAGKSGGGTDAGANSGGTPSTGGSMNTSGTSGAMGVAGDGGGGAGPAPCTGDVADDAACWTSNAYGVFVSSDSGDDDSGDGTKEAPFATITKGIAAAGGKNVYVCLGTDKITYDEKITLTAANDGLHLYGGFECAGWGYATTRKSAVASGENVALRIQSAKNIYIENLTFTASNATGTGLDASSYGAFVTGSTGITLKRVELTAGKGAKGADGAGGDKGADGSKVPGADNAPQKGKPADCAPVVSSQPGGSWGQEATYGTQGGDGGLGRKDGGLAGGNGVSGTPSTDVAPPGVDNGGAGATLLSTKGGRGGDGSDGVAGALGDPASKQGTFGAAGFTAADGASGKKGYPGQGGGGGGGSKGNGTCLAASGGVGGMGGEGGKPGTGGLGGGASVGLLSWGSTVLLSDSILSSDTGGAGGHGGAGGLRGQGGLGAPGGTGSGVIGDGGTGGDGGDGGDGGSGSGGTGGPSYALVFAGTKPSYDLADTTLTPGDGGAAGPGGSVSGVTAPAGKAGDSQPEFEVK